MQLASTASALFPLESLAALFLTTAVAAGPAAAQNTFLVQLDGAQMETPSPGVGTVLITLDPTTGEVTADGTFSGLIGEVGGVHIHGPALPLEHAPVKIPLEFTGTTSGTITGGGFHGSPEEVEDMLCGLDYIVVHTFGKYGGGEIRGQIVGVPEVAPYGSGVNPAGSLTVLSGTATIGTTITFGIDNPTGSQSPPGVGFVYVSTGQDPLYELTGSGIPLAGFGMGGPLGELLISAAPPNPILTLSATGWLGPGTPLPRSLDIPDNKNLVGWRAYAQGLLIAGSTFGLTNGLELSFGI